VGRFVLEPLPLTLDEVVARASESGELDDDGSEQYRI
jgi:hypothetical protein